MESVGYRSALPSGENMFIFRGTLKKVRIVSNEISDMMPKPGEIDTQDETKDYKITVDYKKKPRRILTGSFDKKGVPEDFPVLQKRYLILSGYMVSVRCWIRWFMEK